MQPDSSISAANISSPPTKSRASAIGFSSSSRCSLSSSWKRRFPQNKKKQPYVVEFDRAKDVEQTNVSPDGKKKGIFVKVKFTITLDGSKVEKLGDDYLLIIEEDRHKVKEVSLPKPVASETSTVMLTIDTSGSMGGHGAWSKPVARPTCSCKSCRRVRIAG